MRSIRDFPWLLFLCFIVLLRVDYSTSTSSSSFNDARTIQWEEEGEVDNTLLLEESCIIDNKNTDNNDINANDNNDHAHVCVSRETSNTSDESVEEEDDESVEEDDDGSEEEDDDDSEEEEEDDDDDDSENDDEYDANTAINDNSAHEEPCIDLHERCAFWADIGQCESNPSNMILYCKHSCKWCGMQSHFSVKTREATTTEEEDEETTGCIDHDARCTQWADLGECENSPGYMLSHCRKSCGECIAEEPCFDRHEKCSDWAERGDCYTTTNADFMLSNCRISCETCVNSDLDFGVEQEVNKDDEEQALEVEKTIRQSVFYMREIKKDPTYVHALIQCRNEHKLCSFWASIGECEANPEYMNDSCSPACQSCYKFVMANRCPLDPDAVDALYPGDLNRLFEWIITSPEVAKYEPVVLSRPEPAEDDAVADDAARDYQIGPWVVVFENFLSDEECDRLIEFGLKEGYEQSEEVGELQPDGTYSGIISDYRTSTTAWCPDECYTDPLVRRVIDRIENVTRVPEANSEYLQLLKYEEGQYYQVHHDYIEHQTERQCGVRILTLFLYLNDVEQGGGTRFPELDLTVQPKKGRAVLWPSVLDHDPHARDDRTDHEALAVERGIKYGANAWLHMHDFKTPYENNCID